MKCLIKLFLAFCITATSLSPVFGQAFGIKGGLNLSNMVFHPDGGGSSRHFKVHPGFHLGIITNISLSRLVKLESDLILSTKGINVERKKANGFDPTKGSANLLYLDIPIAVKVFFNSNENAKPYVVAGPYVGFGISGKTVYDGKTQEIHFGSAYNQDFKALDFGLTFGGGIQFHRFLFGLNYDLGIINMFSHNDMGGTIYNRNFRISIGYLFPNRHT